MHKENIDDLGEGTGALNMHQDLLYYENPPGIQVLNCLRYILVVHVVMVNDSLL